MTEAWMHTERVTCVCVCACAPREAITTLGFEAQCVYVESAAVSSHQCSRTASSLRIYSNFSFTFLVVFFFFGLFLCVWSSVFFLTPPPFCANWSSRPSLPLFAQGPFLFIREGPLVIDRNLSSGHCAESTHIDNSPTTSPS